MASYLRSGCSVLLVISCLAIVSQSVVAFSAYKRQIAPQNNAEHLAVSNNPMQISYDEYPLIVPKRAAILLDRLMVALHHALEDERNGSRRISDVYGNRKNQFENGKYFQGIKSDSPSYPPNYTNELTSDHLDIYSEIPENVDIRELQSDNRQLDNSLTGTGFQRRGQDTENNVGPNKGRVYWRCYFNAVTCF